MSSSAQNILVEALNVTLMLSIGLELDLHRLRREAARATLLGGTALWNIVVPLAVAFGLLRVISVSDPIAAGVLLAAAAPGGATGVLLTRSARGNIDLSIVVIALVGLCSLLLAPIWARTLMSGAVGADVVGGDLLGTLFVFQFLPVLAGILVRRTGRGAAVQLQRFARPASNGLFVVLIVSLVATQYRALFNFSSAAFAVMGATVAASLCIGLWPGLERADRAALSMTSAIRNLSLALLIASKFFDETAAMAVLAYGVVMYLMAFAAAAFMRAPATKTRAVQSARVPFTNR